MADTNATPTSSIPPWVGPAVGAGGAILGRTLANNAASNAVPPELSQLLQMGVQRAAYQNPLFQSVNQGIYSMLPSFARQGTSLSGTLSNQAPMPSDGGNGIGGSIAAGATGAGLAALMSALAQGGSSAGGPLGPIIDALKRLFGGGGRNTVQGNQPFSGGALIGPNTFGAGLPDEGMGRSGLPWEQPFLISDPGRYTGFTGTPSDPSGGTGIGPGMSAYYGGSSSEPVDWWKP